MIACGVNHTIIQNEKNEIYVCGHNFYGQFGLIYSKNSEFEEVKCDIGKIKKIILGDNHMMIQNEKNEIYVCGSNKLGQLGLNHDIDECGFEKVDYGLGEIKNIVCGEHHTVIQNEKNEIYVCGYNEYGQLGLGDNEYRYKFEKVEKNFGEIKNIVCGRYHTVIQNEKNEIYVCGGNHYGQLGFNDLKHRNKFEKVVFEFGEIKNIVCGGMHIVIQNEKNDVYVCGCNYHGQLGLNDCHFRNKFEKVKYAFGEIKRIVCGSAYTIVLNDKNEIFVCGANSKGQLGLGGNYNRNKFEKVNFEFGEIKNIVCSYSHTVIQNEKNEIYTCGRNNEGQLGLGDNKDRKKFEKVNVDDIFEKIYNFEFQLNTEEIVL